MKVNFSNYYIYPAKKFGAIALQIIHSKVKNGIEESNPNYLLKSYIDLRRIINPFLY